ncbi:hypothetical protein [Pedobacter alluvionis]|uniref:Uncharacterized protein n=1 Tax=Pedobacter alluvionis TaxID=475253 RepID=A0A497XLA4_9SPHI|nr:hypothetical protein [Pedobacter alluvionis]RLJ69307.1 hypothetical protein BCL90_5229 [Pedobacter alluvionis]
MRIHPPLSPTLVGVKAINNYETLLSRFTIPIDGSYKKEFDEFLKIFY